MSNGKVEALVNIVERLTERVDDLGLLLNVLRTRTEEINHRLNNIEVLLDNLRVELKFHSHGGPGVPATGTDVRHFGADGEENP